jgi:hypothetical protein
MKMDKKTVITGSFESSKVMLRGNPIKKESKGWKFQAFKFYNRISKRLIRSKSEI